ncbi:hypothetical protein Q75_01915 [Bacillus coahuilensis p1.1.43]|uniref:Uncharacterized protein n=1 Tax=Bacillus coahuilensis p1.1.43 TaxID=1150625 RepID=A0A147KBU7_9BACI|nr:DUF6407 family protein [Bacillus coahuilensis]KUP08933.1 hypothetical protein Q75_01915 [Bacillus coahuilensis p1.1.43]
MKQNLHDFVKERLTAIPLDENNRNEMESFQQMIRDAIDYYGLNSYEEVEVMRSKKVHFIYIHSIIEETLLSKVAQIALSDEHANIENVYAGRVIREY